MPRIIANNAPTTQVLEEYSYTLARLQADPLGAPYLETFQAFLEQLKKARDEELRLVLQQITAQAVVDFCDDQLDSMVDAVAHSVLIITNNDRTNTLWRHYFGDKSPSVLKKPILGKQLETMRGWVPSLQGSPHSSLQALGSKLEAMVASADTAVKGKARAEQEAKDFRHLGMRKDTFEAFNSLRKDTAHALSKLPQAHPEKNLPKDFEDQFFRQLRTDSLPGLEDELLQLKEEIGEAEQSLAALKARHEELSQQKAHLEQDEAQHQRDLAELAAAEETAAALRAKVAKKKY